MICTGGLLFLIAKMDGVSEQWPWFPLWWHALGVTALLTMVVCVLGGQHLPLRWLRWLWALVVALVLLGQVTSFAAFSGERPDVVVPWIWEIEPGSVSLMVLLVRPAFAVLYAVLSGVSPLLSGIAFTGQIPHEVAVQTPVHISNFAFVVIFIGIRGAMVSVRRAETLASARAAEETRNRALASQNDEMARVLHDEVLGTLIAASRIPGPPPPELREAAARSRRVLREMTSPADSSGAPTRQVRTEEVQRGVSARVTQLIPDAVVALQSTSGSLPSEVAGAIILATAEAARNSARHAGAGAMRTVTGHVDPQLITITVADTGPAFDVASVDARRLGIRLSIQGRMQAVGGSATVASDARGTVVELRWSAKGGTHEHLH